MNGIGQESGNPLNCDGRSLPWLQDVAGQDVWTHWAVRYRDVVILDAENRVAAVYNLSDNDLAIEANRESLKSLLRSAARR